MKNWQRLAFFILKQNIMIDITVKIFRNGQLISSGHYNSEFTHEYEEQAGDIIEIYGDSPSIGEITIDGATIPTTPVKVGTQFSVSFTVL